LDPKKGGHSRWIINDGSDGIFDAVIATVGTCGAPEWVGFDGMPGGFVEKKKAELRREIEKKAASNAQGHDTTDHTREQTSSDFKSDDDDKVAGNDETDKNIYRGPLLHSSQLDSKDVSELQGKTVLVIGSGASGVEAVETALARGAGQCIMVARDDKVRRL
jgi:hypothetical protein